MIKRIIVVILCRLDEIIDFMKGKVYLDNMNDYYDLALKEYRLSLVEKAAKHSTVMHIFIRVTISLRQKHRRCDIRALHGWPVA